MPNVDSESVELEETRNPGGSGIDFSVLAP